MFNIYKNRYEHDPKTGGEKLPLLYSSEFPDAKSAVEAAVLAETILDGCWLDRHNLAGVNVTDAYMSGASLSGCDLTHAKMHGVTLTDARLYGANLWGADLSGCHAPRASFESAIMTKADVQSSSLKGACFYQADLVQTSFVGANLRNCNLALADCRLADFSGADLSGANLYGADLSGANFGYSNEHGKSTNLDGALVGEESIPLVGSHPVMHVCPSGDASDWMIVFWCGKQGIRISTTWHYQVTAAQYLNSVSRLGPAYINMQKKALDFARQVLGERS